MNKEQISEKDVEKVSGGAVKFTEATRDLGSKHLIKIKCTQCGKMFETVYMMDVISKPDIINAMKRCPECKGKKVSKIESEETK